MVNIDKIVGYLENNEGDRVIAKKNKINRLFLTDRYPRLLNVGSDSTLEEIINEVLDIDRKIRRAKQLNPHLAGDSEEEKEILEEEAKEKLGYTHTP